MFAKSRIAKLKGLIKKENTSMTIKKSNNALGTFWGTNSLKKPKPWFKKPIIISPIKILKEKKQVTIICPVTETPKTNKLVKFRIKI
jgi:hypothetical protein